MNNVTEGVIATCRQLVANATHEPVAHSPVPEEHRAWAAAEVVAAAAAGLRVPRGEFLRADVACAQPVFCLYREPSEEIAQPALQFAS